MLQRISKLKMILVLVAVLLVVPTVGSAYYDLAPVCQPPGCPNPCSSGTYDCTYDWIMADPNNAMLAFFLMQQGYQVIVCCN